MESREAHTLDLIRGSAPRPAAGQGLTKMPKCNVISIVDQLRERRINSLLHRFTNTTDHVEQRFALARMEFELSQRSPDQSAGMELAMGIN